MVTCFLFLFLPPLKSVSRCYVYQKAISRGILRAEVPHASVTQQPRDPKAPESWPFTSAGILLIEKFRSKLRHPVD